MDAAHSKALLQCTQDLWVPPTTEEAPPCHPLINYIYKGVRGLNP